MRTTRLLPVLVATQAFAALATAIAAIAALGIARLTRANARAERQAARTITVLGQGSVEVVPDEARMQVGIRATAPTAQEANARGTAAMTRVLGALTAHGIAERHIQTGYFNVMPEHYSGPDGRMARGGHTVINSVNVTIQGTEKVGDVLDTVIAAGGDEVMVHNVQTMLSDPAPAHVEARRAALADAREQAEQIARDAGLRLGEPLAIHPQQSNLFAPRMAARGGPRLTQHSAAVPIEPGEMRVTASIEVVYAVL